MVAEWGAKVTRLDALCSACDRPTANFARLTFARLTTVAGCVDHPQDEEKLGVKRWHSGFRF